MGKKVYWRFIGEKVWREAYPSSVEKRGLVRMGFYNGDDWRGPVVDENEIETR